MRNKEFNIFTRFLVLFTLIYLGIQALGHVVGVKDAYRQHYMMTIDKVFGDFKKDGIVKANAYSDPEQDEMDVLIMLSSKQLYQEAVKSGTNVRIAKTMINSRFWGFFPLSLILALVLATPLNWKKKIVSLVVSLVLVELFILSRLWLHLMYTLDQYEWIDLVNLSPTAHAVIDFLGGMLIYNVVVGVLVPFLIWILVAVLPYPASPIPMALNHLLSKKLAVNT